jgi:hypothetical protein
LRRWHPAVSSALREALLRASRQTQVIVTSHSPDLLDDRSPSTDSFLAVVSDGGETRVGPLDEASRSIMRDQLFSAGELLRLRMADGTYGETTDQPALSARMDLRQAF